MKKEYTFVLVAIITFSIGYLVLPDFSNNVELNDQWVPSLKKQIIKYNSDKPNEFLKYFKEISTKSGENESGYKPNYRITALEKARKLNPNKGARMTSSFEAVSRGPGNVGGRTRAIIVDPDDAAKNTWFAGSASGGIWKTSDGGSSWANLTPNLPNLSTNSLAMSASNHNVIYAGTGEVFAGNLSFVRGDGVFKSIDRGVTWNQLSSTAGDSKYNSVNRIVIDPVDENTLLMATNLGVFKSIDGGNSWNQTLSGVGLVQDLKVDPSDFNIMYAGANGNGVYKTVDAGENWTKLSGGIGDVARVEIAVSTKNPNKVYVSTYDGDNTTLVYVSTDKGSTWLLFEDVEGDNSNFLGAQGWYDNTIAVNPYNEDEVFIGGVYIGKLEFNGGTVVKDPAFLGVDEENTGSFLAFVGFGSDAGAFNGALEIGDGDDASADFYTVEVRFGSGVSQKAHRFVVPADGGSNGDGGAGIPATDYSYADYVDVPFEVWDVINNKQLMVSFRDQQGDGVFNLNPRDDENDPDLLTAREYIFISNVDYSLTEDASIATNGGGHLAKNMYFFWPISSAPGTWDPSNLPSSIFRIKFDEITVRQGQATIVADPRGDFGNVNTNLHADHHNLTMIPVNESTGEFRILNGNDGGLGISNNGGTSWTQITDGYVTTQFYGADKKSGADEYFGGMQDNGTWQSPNNETASATSQYTEELGGDGFEVIWHSQNPDKMMGSIYNNKIQTSSNGGASWVAAQTGIDINEGPFITRLASSFNTPDVVFAVTASGVYKTSNFGASWDLKPISVADGWTFEIEGSAIITSQHDVEASIANDKIVWAGGRMDGTRKIFVSTDRGETFSATQSFADFGAISGLATHPTEDSTAFVMFSFAGTAKIIRTIDLGQTWEDISGFGSGNLSTNGFPDVLVHCLLVLPNDPNTILAGTEIGLFESNDAGATWAISNSGLPAVSIWNMKVVDDQIVIATHGRGIWTLKSTDLLNSQAMVAETNYLGNRKVSLNLNLPVNYDSVEIFIDGIIVDKLINPTMGLVSIDVDIEATNKNFVESYIYSYISIESYKSGIKDIDVDFSPVLKSFNQNNDDKSVLNGIFTITELYDSLEVYLNDVLITTEKSLVLGDLTANLTISDIGTFNLRGVGYYGNLGFESNVESLVIQSILGIENIVPKLFDVYPNPASNSISYTLPPELVNLYYSVSIVDMKGVTLKSLKQNKFINSSSVNISELKKGVYILKLESKEGVYINRFFKD
jgi:photosystem II stability/assembly factor-like uncharacterized protein